MKGRRKLNAREIFLFVITAIAGLFLAYQNLVLKPFTEKYEEYTAKCDEVEKYIGEISPKAREMGVMTKAIDLAFADGAQPQSIAKYNNRLSVINELNDVLERCDTYSITFAPMKGNVYLVERVINLSYTADGWDDAKQVMKDLYKSEYRCMIDNVSSSIPKKAAAGGAWGDPQNANYERVSVAMTISYFEYNPAMDPEESKEDVTIGGPPGNNGN